MHNMPGDGPNLLLLDSINQIDRSAAVRVVVAGSHGGLYAAYKAASGGARAVILNDAGGGLQSAGIACLDYCDRIGMAAAVVSHHSARIGDGAHMLESGILSGVNRIAGGTGCSVGMPCRRAALLLDAAPAAHDSPPEYAETRFVIFREAPRVVCIDSASLVQREDAGQIVVTGSHGGLIGGNPEKAFNVDARIAVFNDAGAGANNSGLGRLEPLEGVGIAAVTVSHTSARIGDSRSTYDNGAISFVNSIAHDLGARPGDALKGFILDARKSIAGK
jgi:hypothetical protein